MTAATWFLTIVLFNTVTGHETRSSVEMQSMSSCLENKRTLDQRAKKLPEHVVQTVMCGPRSK